MLASSSKDLAQNSFDNFINHMLCLSRGELFQYYTLNNYPFTYSWTLDIVNTLQPRSFQNEPARSRKSIQGHEGKLTHCKSCYNHQHLLTTGVAFSYKPATHLDGVYPRSMLYRYSIRRSSWLAYQSEFYIRILWRRKLRHRGGN